MKRQSYFLDGRKVKVCNHKANMLTSDTSRHVNLLLTQGHR